MAYSKQKGQFWIPNSPDHKVDGEFELIDETIGKLLLYDVIDTSVSKIQYFNEHFQRMQHPLIIGELKDGDCVALLQSSFRSISANDSYEYNIDITIFTGPILIGLGSELEFKKLSFSFDNLPQYLGTCVIERDIQLEPTRLSLKYTSTKEDFILSDSLLCSFNYVFDSSFSSYLSTANASPVTLIELESTLVIGIQDWLKLIDENIGAFFSIAIGKYLCPIRIKVVFEFKSKSYHFDVFYRYFRKHEDMSHNKMLCLRNMMPGLKDYMSEFYKFSMQYSLIINNYITLYKFDAILEYKYLSAVYSIEAFSRYVNQDHCFFSSDEFERTYHNPLSTHINSTYLNETNSDYIHRLKTAIKYSNERSLRAILKQLFNDNKDIIDQIINDKIDVLIAKIVDTRNWYTHFTKELEPLAAKGYELYELYVKVRVLFEICLFKQLQMPDALIVQTIKNTYLID